MPKSSNTESRGYAITADQLASTFAVVVSLAALFVSLIEVNSERAQQRASVWPHVEIGESYSEDGFRIRISNKGIGPALMGRVMLTNSGEAVHDLDQLILDTLGEADAFSYDRYYSSDPSNRVVAAGESVELFGVEWDAQTRQLIAEWNGSVDIEACYCSIHQDCWTTSLQSSQTKRIDSCSTSVALQ